MSGPEPALLLELTRGPAAESRHRGHLVVVDTDDHLLFAAGDPERAIFPRSALKPIQALPTHALGAGEAFGLTGPEIAVMAASHGAEPFHLEAVGGILAKIGATQRDLYCGPHPPGNPAASAELIRRGESARAIHNNCSGKHAGMLALARLLEAPLAGYQDPEHPVQQEIQSLILGLCGVDARRLGWGTDGCGVPNYLMPLRSLALGFARLCRPQRLPRSLAEGARTLTGAICAHPTYVSGSAAFCAQMIAALEGAVIAKSGAEGVYAVGLPGRGWGMALKVEDGSPRGVPTLVVAFLEAAGILTVAARERLERFRRPAVINTRGDAVGEIRCLLDFSGGF